MDAATTVAVFAFLGTVITAIVGALVAIWTNRAEKRQTAEMTIEKVLRERIILRDETIADLREDLARVAKQRDRYKDAADKLRLKEQADGH